MVEGWLLVLKMAALRIQVGFLILQISVYLVAVAEVIHLPSPEMVALAAVGVGQAAWVFTEDAEELAAAGVAVLVLAVLAAAGVAVMDWAA